jgi:hypothetical protein
LFREGASRLSAVHDEKEGTVKNVQEPAERVVANVERVNVGKHLEVRMALVELLCEGHILIEDVPGVGKTMLAKAISRSVGCTFRRIQFTPDLLPSDVTGLSIFNQKTQEFEFRPGPIMAQVVLADELARNPDLTDGHPRQAAALRVHRYHPGRRRLQHRDQLSLLPHVLDRGAPGRRLVLRA